MTVRKHRSVRRIDEIRRQLFPILFNKRREIRAARLLLPFNHELQIDGQTAFCFNIRLYREYLCHDLSFVVPGAAGIDSAVPDGGFERRRSEEHTSELQSRFDLVCRLLLEKKNRT